MDIATGLSLEVPQDLTDSWTVVRLAFAVNVDYALALEWVRYLSSRLWWLWSILGQVKLIGVDGGIYWTFVGVLWDTNDVLIGSEFSWLRFDCLLLNSVSHVERRANVYLRWCFDA